MAPGYSLLQGAFASHDYDNNTIGLNVAPLVFMVYRSREIDVSTGSLFPPEVPR